MIAFFLRLSLSLVRFGHPNYAITHADKRIVNIMQVYIERNKLQVELIGYRKKCLLYSRFNFCKAIDSMHQTLHRQCQPFRLMAAGAHATHIRTFRTQTSLIAVNSEWH